MEEELINYRRNLPHIHPRDGIFFITFLLAGAIPMSVFRKFKEAKEQDVKMLNKTYNGNKFIKEKYKTDKIYFDKLDDYISKNSNGPHWLKNKNLAQIVVTKLHSMNGNRFKLIAFTIMSNHVHLLIDTTGVNESAKSNISGKTRKYPLADTMRLLKGSTSRMCNLELNRTGVFWHHENYDHYVRDEAELNRIIMYIVNNPVKAGLVNDWKDWKFTFLEGM